MDKQRIASELIKLADKLLSSTDGSLKKANSVQLFYQKYRDNSIAFWALIPCNGLNADHVDSYAKKTENEIKGIKGYAEAVGLQTNSVSTVVDIELKLKAAVIRTRCSAYPSSKAYPEKEIEQFEMTLKRDGYREY